MQGVRIRCHESAVRAAARVSHSPNVMIGYPSVTDAGSNLTHTTPTAIGTVATPSSGSRRFVIDNARLIPVVAVGTEDARHAIQTDPQVASRFDPLHLARWKESDAFRNFVAAFGKLLPLRKASAFGQREMVRLLLDRSEGITGRATRLISRAAAEAIQDGTEQVTIERIDEISRRTTMPA